MAINASQDTIAHSSCYGTPVINKIIVFRHELETYLKSGVLSNLFTSFSRDTKVDLNQTRYVQENIKKHKEIVLRLIFKEKGAVYICGYVKSRCILGEH